MKLTLKGSEGAGRGKRKDQAFGLCFKIWQILTLTRDLKVVGGRRMRKVERTEEQREQKNIAQRQRLWHPQHKTAQSRPSESKSHLETRLVLNRGVCGHKHPTSWNGSSVLKWGYGDLLFLSHPMPTAEEFDWASSKLTSLDLLRSDVCWLLTYPKTFRQQKTKFGSKSRFHCDKNI